MPPRKAIARRVCPCAILCTLMLAACAPDHTPRTPEEEAEIDQRRAILIERSEEEKRVRQYQRDVYQIR